MRIPFNNGQTFCGEAAAPSELGMIVAPFLELLKLNESVKQSQSKELSSLSERGYALSKLAVNKGVEPFAVAERDFERAFITHNDQHFVDGVVQHRAAPAGLKMVFDLLLKGWVDIAIDKIREFV